MELTLTEQLNTIERGYQAACFRRQLKQQGVSGPKSFEAWLAKQEQHLVPQYREQAAVGQDFLRKASAVGKRALTAGDLWDAEKAEELKERRIRQLLRTDAVVLWAISVLEERSPMPQHPILIDHIVWVSTFRQSGTPSYNSPSYSTISLPSRNKVRTVHAHRKDS